MVENRNIFIATLVNDNASRSLKYESAEPGEVSDQTGVEHCPEYSQGWSIRAKVIFAGALMSFWHLQTRHLGPLSVLASHLHSRNNGADRLCLD